MAPPWVAANERLVGLTPILGEEGGGDVDVDSGATSWARPGISARRRLIEPGIAVLVFAAAAETAAVPVNDDFVVEGAATLDVPVLEAAPFVAAMDWVGLRVAIPATVLEVAALVGMPFALPALVSNDPPAIGGGVWGFIGVGFSWDAGGAAS